MRIAFVGLGNMGLPMAVNLGRAGHDVLGYDASETARRVANDVGVSTADQLASAVQDVNVAITMLPDGAIARKVWAELAPLLKKSTIAIDCSTIDIASAKFLHDLAQTHGLQSVDAPVSGGTGGAKAATLTFMCGGTAGAIELARPILSAMGKKIVHCGAAGTGQAAKMCNNMVLGISMIAVCEAFALADRLKLDRQAMYDVVSTSSGSCWSINSYCPVPGIGPRSPADNDYAPGFAANLMLKDLRLATEAADEVHAATPLGHHATALYEEFVAAGQGNKDFSAIIKLLLQGQAVRS